MHRNGILFNRQKREKWMFKRRCGQKRRVRHKLKSKSNWIRSAYIFCSRFFHFSRYKSVSASTILSAGCRIRFETARNSVFCCIRQPQKIDANYFRLWSFYFRDFHSVTLNIAPTNQSNGWTIEWMNREKNWTKIFAIPFWLLHIRFCSVVRLFTCVWIWSGSRHFVYVSMQTPKMHGRKWTDERARQREKKSI